MSKSVAIIGGGVIGLCSAYYLIKEGHSVTIIDKSSLDSGASYVNAGLFGAVIAVRFLGPAFNKL